MFKLTDNIRTVEYNEYHSIIGTTNIKEIRKNPDIRNKFIIISGGERNVLKIYNSETAQTETVGPIINTTNIEIPMTNSNLVSAINSANLSKKNNPMRYDKEFGDITMMLFDTINESEMVVPEIDKNSNSENNIEYEEEYDEWGDC